MNKQQTISLRLAQWLGKDDARCSEYKEIGVEYLHAHCGNKFYLQFNPFHSETEGRGQFAECWLKAKVDRVPVDHYFDDDRRIAYQVPGHRRWEYVTHEYTAQGLVDATLEAIFYAIGGTDTWSGA